MKIGILVTSIGNFGKIGYYNSQEIGLARALTKLGNDVVVYKLADRINNKTVDIIHDESDIFVYYIPSFKIGTNGFVDTKELDNSIEAIIVFCGIKIGFANIYRWAKKNSILFYPYIGVVESHSTNCLYKAIIDILYIENVDVLQKQTASKISLKKRTV